MATVIRLITSFGKNPFYLLVALLSFLVWLGIEFLNFSITWLDVFATLATACALELLFANILRWKNNEPLTIFFPASALAAGLGITLFFRALSFEYFLLAAALAIASKYVIRTSRGHIFNPSNFAIVVSAFVFPAATIEFTQWGSNPYIFLLIAALSFFVAWRAHVLSMTVSFAVTYTLLLVFGLAFLPNIFSAHHYGLLGPSFVLFISFMITDPRVAPKEFRARLLHGFAIAALFFVLEAIGVRYSLFLASFLVTILGAISLWLSLRYASAFPPLQNKPLNSISTGIVAILLAATGTSLIVNYHTVFALNIPSGKFLLFGVESPEILRCAPDPVFHPTQAGIEKEVITYGAAWGDIDQDGYDDLFIAHGGAGSALHRNNGDGTFTDITKAAGVSFGPAVSAFFIDYNNDYLPDIFTVVGNLPSWYLYEKEGEMPAVVQVFRNEGGGSFTNVTKDVGLDDFKLETGMASLTFGDYDNNGSTDFVLTHISGIEHTSVGKDNPFTKAVFDGRFGRNTWLVCDPNRMTELYHQLGDRVDRLPQSFDPNAFSGSGLCMIVEYDVNLFSGTLSLEEEPVGRPIVHAAFLSPGGAYLFENHGGVFVENKEFPALVDSIARASTSTGPLGRARRTDISSRHHWQAVSFDYNNDRLTDIFLSVDVGTNRLLKNVGNFTFEDVTEEAEIDYDGSGMGVDVSDYNHDGYLDVVVSNTWKDYLFRGGEGGVFTNMLASIPIGQFGVGWGISFLDYDMDGWDDIFLVNGDVLKTIRGEYSQTNRRLFQADKLYRNVNGESFRDVSHQALCSGGEVGRALAVSDMDNDGDPDVFVGNLYKKPLGVFDANNQAADILYTNTSDNGHAFIKVILRGDESNADGIGAVVAVTDGERTQTKPVLGGNSFYSQSSKTLLFGLGDEPGGPVSVVVRWPSGNTTRLTDVAINQHIEVVE